MKFNKIFTYILLLIHSIVFSQIVIGEERINTSAMLDINTNNKVMILPRVALDDVYNNMSPIENVQEGSIIYNINDNFSADTSENLQKGIYSWNGEKWIYFGEFEKFTLYKNIISIERQNVLGYTPTEYQTEGGRGSESRNCVKWDAEGGNGHYYCLIQEELTWVDAFESAKQLSGYLATINSQAEFDFLDQSFNLFTLSKSKYGNNSSDYHKIGIGWRFVQYSTTKEILKQMKWITGEENLVDWDNTLNQTLGNHFNIPVGSTGKNTNLNVKGKDEGCGVISNGKFTTTTCNSTNNTKKVKYYIIEYNG